MNGLEQLKNKAVVVVKQNPQYFKFFSLGIALAVLFAIGLFLYRKYNEKKQLSSRDKLKQRIHEELKVLFEKVSVKDGRHLYFGVNKIGKVIKLIQGTKLTTKEKDQEVIVDPSKYYILQVKKSFFSKPYYLFVEQNDKLIKFMNDRIIIDQNATLETLFDILVVRSTNIKSIVEDFAYHIAFEDLLSRIPAIMEMAVYLDNNYTKDIGRLREEYGLIQEVNKSKIRRFS